MFTLKGLNASQFIIGNHSLPLFGQFWGLLIQLIDVADLLLKLLILSFAQPVADQVRFEIRLFLKDVRRDGPKSALQSLV